MSKVIHVSDEAHERAKAFCRDHDNMAMSDWVGSLIASAAGLRGTTGPIDLGEEMKMGVVPKKRIDAGPRAEGHADEMQAFASPPFWAKGPGYSAAGK